jgi:peptide/nickel transport system substrate-binding protein
MFRGEREYVFLTTWKNGGEKMSRFNVLSLGAILAVVLIIVGGIGGNGVWAEEYEHIRVGWPRDIVSLDPLGYVRLDRPDLNVHQAIFDHLFRRNEDMSISGDLVRNYEWLNDKTLRLHLRDGITLQDGNKFTAEDVKYSIEDILDPERGPALAGVLETVEKAEVINNTTVDIHTKEPFPTLVPRLAIYTLMVDAERRKGVSPEVYEKQPIGTGAFKFVEWRKGDRIILERNENYWRGFPKIKKLTLFAMPDVTTRVAALKAGKIDIALDLTPPLAREIEAIPHLEATAVPTARVRWIYINTDTPPFNDKRVRQALNYAVNKEELIATLLEGYGFPFGQPAPSFFFGHNPELKPYPYDPKKAKQLLAEAGFPNGFSVTIGAAAMDEEHMRAVAGYLRAVGIDAKLDVKEWTSLYGDLMARKMHPLTYLSWTNWSLLDIDGTLPFVFGCDGKWSYFCNPRIEQLIKEMRTIDQQKRLRLAQEAGRIIHEEAAMVFLYVHYDIHGKRKAIKEFRARRDKTVRFDWLK